MKQLSHKRLKKYAEVLAATGSRSKAIQAALTVEPESEKDMERIKKRLFAQGMYVDTDRLTSKRAKPMNQALFT